MQSSRRVWLLILAIAAVVVIVVATALVVLAVRAGRDAAAGLVRDAVSPTTSAVPRAEGTVVLVIDVSRSVEATDVSPSRLEATKAGARHFADVLNPGIHLGLVMYAGDATVLVAPTTNRDAFVGALDRLEPDDRTATGAGIFTALDLITSLRSSPNWIVLQSDGLETVPADSNAPTGAFAAAQAARDQGITIDSIALGTPYGEITVNGQTQPAPVDDDTLRGVSNVTGGEFRTADSLADLNDVYDDLAEQIAP